MSDVLDVTVPREMLAEFEADDYFSDATIEELGEHLVLGSLRRVPVLDVGVHEAALRAKGLCFTTLITDREAYILYYQKLTEHVQRAIRLEVRDLGLEEPPLTLREHLQLAECYGVSEEMQQKFKERIVKLLRESMRDPDLLEEAPEEEASESIFRKV